MVSIGSCLKLPTAEEYRARFGRLIGLMETHEIDVIAFTGEAIVRFLTGLYGLPVTRPIWLVVVRKDQTLAFVSPGGEVGEIKARTTIDVGARWIEWHHRHGLFERERQKFRAG